MTKNDWYEAGDQIKRIVQDAVDTGDFSQIGGAISDVVNDTLDGLLGNGNYRGSGRSNGQTYDSYDQTNDGYGRAYDSYDQANGDAYGSGQSYKNASGAGTDDRNYETAGQTYQSPGSGSYNTGSQTYQSSGSGSFGSGRQPEPSGGS
ncbi:MAG: hypothetical protein LUF30_08405, partial [Lachnospiraceae bacterium]|nr:hypothetical protein [Lachnospiraceae bacterium]